MKLLIISDSHGREICDEIFKLTKPDIAIHAGDSQLESDDIELSNYDYVARGNCDFGNFKQEQVFSIDGINIFLCHGDKYFVKQTNKYLVKKAKKLNCKIVIHGHTHAVKNVLIDGIRIINPGSLAYSRCSYEESFMLVDFDDIDKITLYSANTYEEIGEI